MKNLLSFEHPLKSLSAIIAIAAFLGVLQTFIIGKHYIIPTILLVLAVLFGNLARSGSAMKEIPFWILAIATCHTFFALFWAKTPREILGDAFLYVYAIAFVVLALLSWLYAKRIKLFQ
jgi:hypothetical protein